MRRVWRALTNLWLALVASLISLVIGLSLLPTQASAAVASPGRGGQIALVTDGEDGPSPSATDPTDGPSSVEGGDTGDESQPANPSDDVPDDAMVVPQLTTETSTTYELSDGSLLYVGSVAVVNYVDDQGDWQPVDNSLVDVPGADYAVENTAGDYSVQVPADASADPVAITSDDLSFTMKLRGLDGDPQVDGDTAVFADAPGADSVGYTAMGTGVKEVITLGNTPTSGAGPQYVYDITIDPGTSLALTAQGNIEAVDSAGQVVATIPAATMTDSAEVPANSADVTYALSQAGDRWVLTMTPSVSWLTDPARVYPVLIDPTVNPVPYPATRDCVLKEENPTVSFCRYGNDDVRVGTALGTAGVLHQFRGLVDFDIASIPTNATLTQGLLQVHTDPLNTDALAVSDNQAYLVYTTSNAWNVNASWNNATAGLAWAAGPGGGPVMPQSPEVQVIQNSGSVNFDVQSIVQPWVTRPASKTGMVIAAAPQNMNHVAAFYPSTADDTKRERLLITYTTPDGPPIPYEPPAPSDTFPLTSGQGLPPVGTTIGVTGAVSDETATAQSLPAAASATATVVAGGAWSNFGSTPVAVRGSQVRPAGQSSTAGSATTNQQIQMSLTRLNGDSTAPNADDATTIGSPTVQMTLATQSAGSAPSAQPGNPAVTSDSLELRLNYGNFGKAYGGSFADRLQVRAYPACYATTPGTPSCQISTVVPSVNDVGAQALTFAAAAPLTSGQFTPPAPTSEQLDGCFTRTGRSATVWTTPDSTEGDDQDTITTNAAPTNPTSDSGGSFDDANAASDPSVASTTQPNPATTTDATPSPAALSASAVGNSACRGLVYQASAGPGPYAMTNIEGGGTSLPAAATLSPSAQWQVGAGSGEFTWSYPFALPTGLSNTVPQLALNYSSASLDGNSSQASPAGLGWTLDPGHISRTYAACSDDNMMTDQTGDLCWRTDPDSKQLVDDLSLVLEGHSTRLIQDATTKKWRLQDDPGWRVEHFASSLAGNFDGVRYPTGSQTAPDSADPDNADGNNESFRITSTDGTQYFFGYYPDSNSVWTVPVRANDSNEPCYGANVTITDEACQQAWQWSLDKVIDSDGNRVRYYYDTETNYYHSGSSGSNVPYTRAGRLKSVKYGYRKAADSNDAAQITVNITSTQRCNQQLNNPDPNNPICPEGPRKKPKAWPDVPTDLLCGASGDCNSLTPAFFSTYRYYQVTTVRGRPNDPGYTPIVDQYTLNQSMPDPDDVKEDGVTHAGNDDPDLWLKSITHGGSDDDSRNLAKDLLPDVTFDGIPKPNLVVPQSDGSNMRRFRLDTVTTELGGRTQVNYGFPQDPDDSTKTQRCTPSYVSGLSVWASAKDCFAPRDMPSPVWMHKYLVLSTTLGDQAIRLGQTPQGWTSPGTVRRYRYEYRGKPGWRFAGASGNIPFKFQSWSDWRGYQTTIVKTMQVQKSSPAVATDTAKSVRSVLVYRGLNYSRIDKSGAIYKTLTVPTVELSGQNGANQPLDSNYLQGNVAEETTLKPSGDWIARAYHGYTAYRTASNSVLNPDTGKKTSGLTAHFSAENISVAHVHVTRPCPQSQPSCAPSHATNFDRRHTVITTFDRGDADHEGLRLGTVTGVVDYGSSSSDNAPGDDNVCTTNSWIGNSDTWLRVPTQTIVMDGLGQNQCSTLRRRTDMYYEAAETQTGDRLNNGHLTRQDVALTDQANSPVITTRSSYDQYGRVTATIDGNGNQSTTVYNGSGAGTADDLVAKITDTTNPTIPAQRRTTVTALEPTRGLPKSVQDLENNNTTKMAYDGYGRLTSVVKPNLAGTANATSMTYSYRVTDDEPSKTTTVTRRASNADDTSVAYMDGWGRNIETQTPQATGVNGRLLSGTAYDELGQPYVTIPVFASPGLPGSGLVNPAPDSAVRSTRTQYDAASRPVQIVNKQAGGTEHDTTTIEQRGDSTVVQPDANGAPAAVNGQTITTVDGWGRTTKVEQDAGQTYSPALHSATYNYNGASELTGMTSTVNAKLRRWAYGYDLAGRRVSTLDPDTGATSSTYDNNSNQLITYNLVDGTVKTIYDAQDRPTKRFKVNTTNGPAPADCTATAAADPSCTKLAEWTYDTASRGVGMPAKTTSYNPYNQLGTYTATVTGYDRNGNTLGVTAAFTGDITGNTATATTQSWTYNDADLPTSTTYGAVGNLPDLKVTTAYTNNALVASEAASDGTNLLTAVYDKAGEPLRALSGTADVTHHLNREYAWDYNTGWLSRVGGSYFGTLDYAYDRVGNPTRITADNLYTNVPTADPSRWCYTYDPLNRLATAKTGAGTAGSNYDCATPAADTNLVGDHQDLAYAYADDRLTTVTSTAAGVANTATYAYTGAAPHQTSRITSASGDPALPPGGTLGYDEVGRIAQLRVGGGNTTYMYNPTGSPRTSTAAGTTSNYAYDDNGFRVARQTTGQGSVVYLGDTEIATDAAGVVSTRRVLNSPGGKPLGVQYGTGTATNRGTPTWTYVLGDAQDSVRYTRDQSKGPESDTRPTYRPFGQAIAVSGASERGYLNKSLDANGDVRLDQRNYQPQLNVLTTPDEVISPDSPTSLNPYTYAGNNPAAFTDPSGLVCPAAVTVDPVACPSQTHIPATIVTPTTTTTTGATTSEGVSMATGSESAAASVADALAPNYVVPSPFGPADDSFSGLDQALKIGFLASFFTTNHEFFGPESERVASARHVNSTRVSRFGRATSYRSLARLSRYGGDVLLGASIFLTYKNEHARPGIIPGTDQPISDTERNINVAIINLVGFTAGSAGIVVGAPAGPVGAGVTGAVFDGVASNYTANYLHGPAAGYWTDQGEPQAPAYLGYVGGPSTSMAPTEGF